MEEYWYIGYLPCGCAVCGTSGDPSWKREAAKSVAEWLRDGLRIERVPVERARQILGPCVHKAHYDPRDLRAGDEEGQGDD